MPEVEGRIGCTFTFPFAIKLKSNNYLINIMFFLVMEILTLFIGII